MIFFVCLLGLKTMLLAGLLEQGEGPDARSRLVTTTALGRAKRADAQKKWRAAQISLKELLGVDHVVALHEIIDKTLVRQTEAGLTEEFGK